MPSPADSRSRRRLPAEAFAVSSSAARLAARSWSDRLLMRHRAGQRRRQDPRPVGLDGSELELAAAIAPP